MLTSRLPEDQPGMRNAQADITGAEFHDYTEQVGKDIGPEGRFSPRPCTCFSPEHKFWCAKRTADLVPGYPESREAAADLIEQRKADAR